MEASICVIAADNEVDLDQIPGAKLPAFVLLMVAFFGNLVLLDLQRRHGLAGVAGTALHGTCVATSSCIQPACRCVAALLRQELLARISPPAYASSIPASLHKLQPRPHGRWGSQISSTQGSTSPDLVLHTNAHSHFCKLRRRTPGAPMFLAMLLQMLIPCLEKRPGDGALPPSVSLTTRSCFFTN